jgi:hypothetical protein
MADLFARYGADHYFDEVEDRHRDGSNLEIPGFSGISFGFSIWTTIEECTNPAIVWESGEGWHTVQPFSDPEPFWLPEGVGMVEVAHVEHEEVICIGRAAPLLKGVKKATFKYALGEEFINAMEVFKAVNIDKKEKIKVGDCTVSPRDVVAAAPVPPDRQALCQQDAATWIRSEKTSPGLCFRECVGGTTSGSCRRERPSAGRPLGAHGRRQWARRQPRSGTHVPGVRRRRLRGSCPTRVPRRVLGWSSRIARDRGALLAAARWEVRAGGRAGASLPWRAGQSEPAGRVQTGEPADRKVQVGKL